MKFDFLKKYYLAISFCFLLLLSPNIKAEESTYTVQKGDSLFLIAEKTLGDGNRWKEIYALNKLKSTRQLKVGQTIKIPVENKVLSASINGQLTSKNQTLLLSDVLVFLNNLETGETIAETRTDSQGVYKFEKVALGSYQILFESDLVSVDSKIVSLSSVEPISLVSAVEDKADETASTSKLDEEYVRSIDTIKVSADKMRGYTIGRITKDKIDDAPITNVQDVLTGRTPGVQVNLNSGLVGETGDIRIRGTSSLTQSNQPTIYIDGVRIDNTTDIGGNPFSETGNTDFPTGGTPSRFNELDPNIIERIEVLKGPAAAARFGTQGANGVINIITKKGVKGKPVVTLTHQASLMGYPLDRYAKNTGFATTQEKADELSALYGIPNLKPYQLFSTNFYKDQYKAEWGRTTSISVNGGQDGISYYVSGRFEEIDGPYNEDGSFLGKPFGDASDIMKKNSVSMGLNIDLNDKINVKFSGYYTDSRYNQIHNNNNIFATTAIIQGSKPELANENNATGSAAFTTARETTFRELSGVTDNIFASFNLNYKLNENTNISVLYGANVTEGKGTNYTPYGWNVDGFSTANVNGFLIEDRGNNRNYTFSLKADHYFEWNSFDFSTLAGIINETSSSSQLGATGSGFSSPGLETISGLGSNKAYQTLFKTANTGFFLSERIGYESFLYLGVGVRQDQNTSFGKQIDAIPYYHADLSWDAVTMMGALGPFSSLVLRTSFGEAGTQPDAVAKDSTFMPLSTFEGSALVPENMGNDNLKPEKTTEIEYGVDLGLWDDRLFVELTFFDKKTVDGLIAQRYPASNGFVNTQLNNIGKWKANGIELGVQALLYQDLNIDSNKCDLCVDVSLSFSYIDEKILSLGGAPEQKVGGSYPRYRNFITEGYTPGANFGAKLVDTPYPIAIDGLCDAENPCNEAQLLAWFEAGNGDGILKGWEPMLDTPTQEDVDAKRAKDLTQLGWYLGKPKPDFTGNLNIEIKFLERFKFTSGLEARWGNYRISNLTNAFRKSHPGIGINHPDSSVVSRDIQTGGVDENYTPQNSAQVRLDSVNKWVKEIQALSPYSGLNTFEDASFLRVRELGLSYDTPFADFFGVEKLHLKLKAKNIGLFTPYSGVDPETNANSSRNGGLGMFLEGVEAFGVPVPWVYMFEVSIEF